MAVGKAVQSIMFAVACAGVMSCKEQKSEGITITSCVLRNRIIVMEEIILKKALYAAFTLPAEPLHDRAVVRGVLLCNGKQLAESAFYGLQGKNGSLVFDLPPEIPDGLYTIYVDADRGNGRDRLQGSLTIKREDIRSTIGGGIKSPVSVGGTYSAGIVHAPATTAAEQAAGYILYHHSPWETADASQELPRAKITGSLSVRSVRNEYEPVTFSMYSLRELGQIQVSVSQLTGSKGRLPAGSIQVGHIEPLNEFPWDISDAAASYPQVIRRGERVMPVAGSQTIFWLTLKVGLDVAPGEYRGNVVISPQFGAERRIPITITVEPVALEDIPGKDFFMLMTYEFTELTMPWTPKEKEQIYQSAYNVLKDYRAHGMTTVCIHSPFVFINREDGSPQLEDVYAALRAARDAGFTRPIIWYVGHLVQTAKPTHPGNILAFEKDVHLPRLKALVRDVTAYAKKNNCPEVIVLPIDEPDDNVQDPGGRRRTVTPELLQAVREAGARAMITARSSKGLGPLDFLCSSDFDRDEMISTHAGSAAYLMYNNDVTTKCDNPAYARYIYGFYTWMTGIDGMSSWTFQNTQNASLKTGDVFLAYPDPAGPLSTPGWEAVREGIDDHKLTYQLVKRINDLKHRGMPTARYENFLADVRTGIAMPDCTSPKFRNGSEQSFHTVREKLISLIVEAEQRMSSAAGAKKRTVH